MTSRVGSAYTVAGVRQGYPRAYEPWSEFEDAFVRDALGSGQTGEQISVTLGRTYGAICSRLEHLGVEVPSGPGTFGKP
jgi:hypothetical protein